MLRYHLFPPSPRHLLTLALVTAAFAATVLLTGCAGAAADAAALPAEAALPAQNAPVSAAQISEDVDADAPSRLEIPSIHADMPVVKLGWHSAMTSDDAIFSEWDVAEYAAGWHKNSALPGEPGNIVMSGHNNIFGSVFRELDQLRAGDQTIVWHDGERHAYTVDQVMIVPEKYASDEQRIENAKWIGEFDDERLTLVSCWPRNNNTHRIIVVAHPADETRRADTVRTSVEGSGP